MRMGTGIRSGSQTDRVAKFFTDNPDEELTLADMRIKFGFSESQANGVLLRLRYLGIVETSYVIRAKRG